MHHDHTLTVFSQLYPRLTQCCDALRARIEAVLRDRGIQVHQVSARVKSHESLGRKLRRPDRTYASLWDLTDLVGLRVVVYFEDAIDDAARALESIFTVDYSHSIDKLRFVDHGRFGYRSLHLVCTLEDEALPPEARFEVQLRTVVQHAWAEVEHDLGYKSRDAVPAAIRRRFSRVASLLEIADEEFVSIRQALESHARSAREAVANQTQDFPLDVVSLDALARSPEVDALDATIAATLQRPLSHEVFYPEYLTQMLQHAGLHSTRAVHSSLRAHAAEVPALVRPYFDFAASTWRFSAASLEQVYRGYALFFLAHVEILRAPGTSVSKVSRLTQLYQALDYPDDERTAQRVAATLLHCLQG
jgi:ppGpp synthetase/RelA/SpoT-type nucleotidyltranferase